MHVGSSMSMIIIIIFVCLTIISLGGMGVITNSMFNIKNNIISISDSEIAMSRIALGFYWALCIIVFILTIYIFSTKN